MRKKDIQDQLEIDNLIKQCEVCYLGMTDLDGLPYVLPFNFGYKEGRIYLHSAKEGRKMEILKSNPSVCAAFSTDHQLHHQHEDVACSYSMKYRSVLAFGKVSFIESIEEKTKAMNIIMEKYTGRQFKYHQPSIVNVQPFYIEIEKITAKSFGY